MRVHGDSLPRNVAVNDSSIRPILLASGPASRWVVRPVDAPAAADDAQMAPAPEPPEDDAPRAPDDAAPDETLDEPPAPPRRARAASDASDAGEPKRQRVDAPAPAPDESDASEASDESGSKRGDEGDGDAAPPPPSDSTGGAASGADGPHKELADSAVTDSVDDPSKQQPECEEAAAVAAAAAAAEEKEAEEEESLFQAATEKVWAEAEAWVEAEESAEEEAWSRLPSGGAGGPMRNTVEGDHDHDDPGAEAGVQERKSLSPQAAATEGQGRAPADRGGASY